MKTYFANGLQSPVTFSAFPKCIYLVYNKSRNVVCCEYDVSQVTRKGWKCTDWERSLSFSRRYFGILYIISQWRYVSRASGKLRKQFWNSLLKDWCRIKLLYTKMPNYGNRGVRIMMRGGVRFDQEKWWWWWCSCLFCLVVLNGGQRAMRLAKSSSWNVEYRASKNCKNASKQSSCLAR